jgi:hypothetical protein
MFPREISPVLRLRPGKNRLEVEQGPEINPSLTKKAPLKPLFCFARDLQGVLARALNHLFGLGA